MEPLPDVKTLSNYELWKCVQTPIRNAFPEEIKRFLKKCKEEFFNRDTKDLGLHFIISAK